jgi:hypothetical protein
MAFICILKGNMTEMWHFLISHDNLIYSYLFTVICLEINEIDHFKGLIFLRIHKSDQLNISKCHLSAYWKEIWHKCDIFLFLMLIWFTVICLKINEIDHFKGLVFLKIHKSDKLNKSKWHLFAYWREIWQKCNFSYFPC